VDASLVAAGFAISAAFVWGTGDFTSGFAARRIGAFHALLVSFCFGLLAILGVTLASGEPLPAASDLVWGAVGGLLGTGGFMAMLHGFAKGRMSIVAPVSAVLTAGIPMLIGVFTIGLPRELQLVGCVLALVSMWLLSLRSEEENRPSGFLYAILAGIGFAAFFTALDQINEGVVFWPLVASRLTSTLVLGGIALARKQPLVPAGAPMRLLVFAGILDVLGNLLFLMALQTGRLDIASVLVSLYPGVTVLLAALIEKERLTRIQVVGVALAIMAVAMITV
jgi:drug/metabolite transporter (DMT)-like permease